MVFRYRNDNHHAVAWFSGTVTTTVRLTVALSYYFDIFRKLKEGGGGGSENAVAPFLLSGILWRVIFPLFLSTFSSHMIFYTSLHYQPQVHIFSFQQQLLHFHHSAPKHLHLINYPSLFHYSFQLRLNGQRCLPY